MGQKVPPGLIKRGNIWYIRKAIAGRKVQESTGTSDLKEAERFLVHRIEEARNAQIYGIRPKRTFREAATRYLSEETKKSLHCEAVHLKMLDPFIGDLPLEAVHMGSLQTFIKHRRGQGRKARTINYGLQVVRHILNLCAGEWMDEHGMTWLHHPPKIKLLREDDKKEPYPLSWAEQTKLFAALPEHLRMMSFFAFNTGLRNKEVCGLQWDDEVEIDALNTRVFIIPKERIKNREDRLVVLNSVARAVIDRVRDDHPVSVFTYRGSPVRSMYHSAWKSAREEAGLPSVRVHDLKHTYGRRLRSVGVSFEDRQDLLGHKSGKITTHYSAPELINLIQASERVCSRDRSKMGTTIILRKQPRHLRAV